MGKKYRNLISQIIAPENMRSAIRKTADGRRFSHGTLRFKEFSEVNLSRLTFEMHTGEYRPGEPRQFWVYEPKPRLITAMPFRDRVAQHALCNIIGPIFDRTLLPRTFACRKGKGAHRAVVLLQSDLRRLSRQGPVSFLKTDFSRFFPSIDMARLHEMIRAKISCGATLRLISSMVRDEGIGLPIGSLTSQLFANVYAGALDRHLQQSLGEKYWYRYMDDLVVLGHNQAHLRALKDEVERFSMRQLGLRFSRWSVAPASRGINFLGYRIWCGHKLLRKQSVVSAKRKIARYTAAGNSEALDKFLASWGGHVGWADCSNLLKSVRPK